MPTTIELIKQLRAETGAGVLDCRLALEQASASFPEALAALREKAIAKASKHSDREASQGMLELYSHAGGRIGVIVEVSCETDFAARSPAFRGFAHEIALHIAAAAPRWVRDEDIPAAILAEEAEKAAARASAENKPAAIHPRIIEGTLNKFKDRGVLLRQVYIRDDTLTIQTLLSQAAAAVGENIIIRRFVRWEFGQET